MLPLNAEIKWLIALGLKRNLFAAEPCKDIIEALGEDADIVTFAEQLLQIGACFDFDAMQALVEESYAKAQEARPPQDPFDPDSKPEEVVESEAPKADCPDLPDFESLGNQEEAAACMHTLLEICHAMNASDLHLSANSRPFIRSSRELYYLSESKLTPAISKLLNTALLRPKELAEFESDMDLDFALGTDNGQRYRVNLMAHKEGVAGTYRIVSSVVPKLEDLGFNNLHVIRKLLSYNNGLILLTGPVGSGKTTTLAAMIDELNHTRNDHLIVVEEPIEIVQHSQHCHITQREVGNHTQSFSNALRGALRQDPDIIVIGEMRDLETIEMAISAAETGHLVIGTLHTNNAANTLNRVLDVFPATQQTQIRAMLSHALRGIICQNLLPSKDGNVVLAYEMLVSNTAVSNLISDNKPEGLKNVMETGAAEGMQLMDKSIFTLWESGQISNEVALRNLRNKMQRKQIQDRSPKKGPTL